MPIRQQIKRFAPKAMILSGGPESVYDAKSPAAPPEVFELGVPVLGICYGMQTMAAQLGGQVESAAQREFGAPQVRPTGASRAARRPRGQSRRGGPAGARRVDEPRRPGRRAAAGISRRSPRATMRRSPPWPTSRAASMRLQFHPEVTHTLQGGEILRRFVREIAGCGATWAAGQHHRGQRRADPRPGGPRRRCCSGCPAASIPRCSRRCCTGPSARSSPAYSSITGCCASARATR